MASPSVKPEFLCSLPGKPWHLMQLHTGLDMPVEKRRIHMYQFFSMCYKQESSCQCACTKHFQTDGWPYRKIALLFLFLLSYIRDFGRNAAEFHNPACCSLIIPKTVYIVLLLQLCLDLVILPFFLITRPGFSLKICSFLKVMSASTV